MRWAAYCRVSTDEQAKQGTSLQTQLERIRAHVPPGDTLLEPAYVDDGYSAATLDRPALQRLLADARAKKIDGVMIYKTDRLSRSIKDIVRLVLDEFIGLDIVFKSATEPYDTSTPQGRLFFTQLAGFADFEREMIRERSALGRLKRAREGVYVGNHFLLGYRYDPQSKTLKQVPEEAQVAREIFRMCNELNLGIHCIADQLNRQGIPTALQRAQAKLIAHPKRTQKLREGHIKFRRGKFAGRIIELKACRWTTAVVYRILTNPIYYGEYRYNRRVSKTRQVKPREEWIEQRIEEPIIDKETFLLAQQRMQDRRKWTTKPVKFEYLLSGLLVCAECGQRLHGVTYSAYQKFTADGQPARNRRGKLIKHWKTTAYYRCLGRHSRSRLKCGLSYARIDQLDRIVWEAIRQCVRRPQPLLDQSIERQRQELGKHANQLPRLILEKERELARMSQAIDKTLDAYTFGDLARTEFLPRIEQLRAKKRSLEAELAALRLQDRESAEYQDRLQILQASLQEVKATLDTMNWRERRELLRQWITRIMVHQNGRVEIFGVLQPPEPSTLEGRGIQAAEHCYPRTVPGGDRRLLGGGHRGAQPPLRRSLPVQS